MPQKPSAIPDRGTERMAEAVERALSGALKSFASQPRPTAGPALFPGGVTKIKLTVNVTNVGSFDLEVSGPEHAKPMRAEAIAGAEAAD